MSPSARTLVAIVASGPKRESAVEVVNSFMFEASGRGRPAARAQRALPERRIDDEEAARAASAAQQLRPQALAEGPPAALRHPQSG